MRIPIAISFKYELLDLEPGADLKSVKTAYARQLTLHNPEEDPEGWMRIHQAYLDIQEWLSQPDQTDDTSFDLDDFFNDFEDVSSEQKVDSTAETISAEEDSLFDVLKTEKTPELVALEESVEKTCYLGRDTFFQDISSLLNDTWFQQHKYEPDVVLVMMPLLDADDAITMVNDACYDRLQEYIDELSRQGTVFEEMRFEAFKNHVKKIIDITSTENLVSDADWKFVGESYLFKEKELDPQTITAMLPLLKIYIDEPQRFDEVVQPDLGVYKYHLFGKKGLTGSLGERVREMHEAEDVFDIKKQVRIICEKVAAGDPLFDEVRHLFNTPAYGSRKEDGSAEILEYMKPVYQLFLIDHPETQSAYTVDWNRFLREFKSLMKTVIPDTVPEETKNVYCQYATMLGVKPFVYQPTEKKKARKK